jgi:hypothetical protein
MKLRRKHQQKPVVLDPKDASDRRKALKAIGKFGLYTAPALLALLESGRAQASGVPVNPVR